MLQRTLNFIHNSSYSKHFMVCSGLTIWLTIANTFSVLPLLAVILSGLPILANLSVLNDKLSYDQKQHFILIPLLFSSIFWALHLWFNLSNQTSQYTLVFVAITSSALIIFPQFKQRAFMILPVLITFIVLLITRQVDNSTLLALITIALIALFLFFKKENSQNSASAQVYETGGSKNKLDLISELDLSKIECEKLQEKFKQMEFDLSAAEMAKMEFLATMSHEIRTPLNGIIPLLDILLDSDMSDFQKDYLSTAHVSAIQMQKLIDDLLDYSKVEAGKLTVEISGLKILRIVEAVKASYDPAAVKKNISIETDIHKNISPLLRGDPTRLRQVLSNLVSNAIKFSHRGTIKIEAKKIKDFPNKEVIRFKITDEGIGMDKETCDNIFLAFTQGDGSSTRKFGGTGLGLAISKKIVELMHGNISVESKKGIGSTFYFDLPLLKSAGETQLGSNHLQTSSGYQAIVVNTNPLLFNKVCQNLKNEDVSFQKALGLAQAYDMYNSIIKVSIEEKSVLIFIDFETAGKHVRTLCSDITQDKSLANLYACILSDNQNIAGIPQHKNISFLEKNDSIAELLDKISVAQAASEMTLEGVLDSNEDTLKSAITKPANEKQLAQLVPEILLVEDNEVNLKVAEKLIQYIGYPFDYAMNGQEAYEKVKKTRYRMILMDCQMPVMDGYRCTAKIRDFEAASGLNHTPILAMTANAMMGDREKCLDAGMDDYMSKPLNRYLLEKTLKKWDPLIKSKEPNEKVVISKQPTNIVEEPQFNNQKIKAPSEPSSPQAINQKWLSTKILAGLEEIMGKEIVVLLNMFEQETPSIIKKIEIALENNAYGDVKKMAHMLKSTSSNVGANGLSFFSRKLELAAGNNDISQLKIIFTKVKKAYILTNEEISKYLNS